MLYCKLSSHQGSYGFSTEGEEMRKKIAALATAALMAVTLGALAGCGADDEQIIRDGLTEEFETIKNMDEATLGEYVQDMDAEDFADFGIDPEEFVKTFFADFDYEIGEIVIDGDTADATVTLTNKSFAQFQSEIERIVTELMESTEAASMDQEAFYALYGQKIMEALNNVAPATAEPIVVECTKDGNTWVVDDAASQEVISALMTI